MGPDQGERQVGINDCCKASMNQIEDGKSADGFVKTSERKPIGKDITLYTCSECEVHWCHTQQTFDPFKSTWAEVN